MKAPETVTNHGDDGSPVPQFLNPKSYLGGEKINV